MKQNIQKLLFISSIFIAFILSACSKSETKESTEVPAPTVNFIKPAKEQQFNEYDSIWVLINISAEDDLHDYSIRIDNITENTEAHVYNGHSHGNSATANLLFIPTVSVDAIMQITVTTLDHNGNINKKTSLFKVKNSNALPTPFINITSPSLSTYNNGSTIKLTGSIGHVTSLKIAQITLTKNGVEVLKYAPLVNGLKNYLFDTTYQINVTQNSDFIVSVTATDSVNITASKTYNFNVTP
ncbi:MAG: hypothetical protein V4538_17510 [Bacteroidota bacterium]